MKIPLTDLTMEDLVSRREDLVKRINSQSDVLKATVAIYEIDQEIVCRSISEGAESLFLAIGLLSGTELINQNTTLLILVNALINTPKELTRHYEVFLFLRESWAADGCPQGPWKEFYELLGSVALMGYIKELAYKLFCTEYDIINDRIDSEPLPIIRDLTTHVDFIRLTVETEVLPLFDGDKDNELVFVSFKEVLGDIVALHQKLEMHANMFQ